MKALIVVDILNDFIKGGTLPVPIGDNSDEAITAWMTKVNAYVQNFNGIKAFIRDFHGANHSSFAQTHGTDPFTTTEMPYGTQVLWPVHCVKGTQGSDFHPLLDTTQANVVILKGTNDAVDSYSAFFENDKKTETGLCGYLLSLGVTEIVVIGLAYDFCVGYTALDGSKYFKTTVIEELTGSIDLNGSKDNMTSQLLQSGVKLAWFDKNGDIVS